MKIAYIHICVNKREGMDVFVDYLQVEKENETHYILEEQENGMGPRGDALSKELDYEAAKNGYMSLNMPGFIHCDPYEVRGDIYVLEKDIEKGKQMLQQALLYRIDREIKDFENLKQIIAKG